MILIIISIFIILLIILWYNKDYFKNNLIIRPNHPKWYEDLPENHPDVQNFYKDSEEFIKSTKKYTPNGYKKIKMPKDIFMILKDATNKTNRINEDAKNIFPRSHSGLPPYIIPISEESKKSIEEKLRPIMEEWAGFPLTHVATYGPREYRKTSALRMHVDRETHIISCILNISQEGCKGDWALQVREHDGIIKDIYMEPGDMVLYESRTVMHGRPTKNPCESYINIFLHWQPAESVGGIESTKI